MISKRYLYRNYVYFSSSVLTNFNFEIEKLDTDEFLLKNDVEIYSICDSFYCLLLMKFLLVILYRDILIYL